jgi:hypothetical protein
MRSKRQGDSRFRKKTKRIYGGGPKQGPKQGATQGATQGPKQGATQGPNPNPEYLLIFDKDGIEIKEKKIGTGLQQNAEIFTVTKNKAQIPLFINRFDMYYGITFGTNPPKLYTLNPEDRNRNQVSDYINTRKPNYKTLPVVLEMNTTIKDKIQKLIKPTNEKTDRETKIQSTRKKRQTVTCEHTRR